jgi:zinc transport system substrate-binding protein
MNGLRVCFCQVATAIVALSMVAGCRRESSTSSAPGSSGAPIRVTGSIFPLTDVLKQVGSDRVETDTLLPPGQTPHGYEPTPALAEKLATSRLLVMVGLGIDDWARRGAVAAGGRGPRIVELGAVLSAGQPTSGLGGETGHSHEKTQEHGHEADHDADHGGHDHAGTDPHVWLDPVVMMRFADAIAGALSEVDPAGRETYFRNAAGFRKELEDLDRLCASRLKQVPHKEFVTLHAAFGLFAKRYGLAQLALRHTHAEETGPKQMEDLVAFIRKHQVKVVFAEPQFPPEKLLAIARQAGVGTAMLDPIGARGVPGHDSYVALMKTNLDALVDALSK